MSISAVSGVAQAFQKDGKSSAVSPPPGMTPFGQQLDDIQTNHTLAAHGHHRGRGGETQPATGATALAAGASPYSRTAASLLSNLLP
jgi:hypothetical protein